MSIDLTEQLMMLETLDQGGAPANVLPIDRVIEDPDQPRKSFDAPALDELAQSIRTRGILQPLVVQPADADGNHRIVAGARRYRAAQLAKLTEVPVVIRQESDGYDQMIENLQRADLSHSEIADWIASQLQAGEKQASIARHLGKSRPWVALYASLAKHPPALRAHLDAVGAQTASLLFDAHQVDQEEALAFLNASESSITREAARIRTRELERLTMERLRPGRGLPTVYLMARRGVQ